MINLFLSVVMTILALEPASAQRGTSPENWAITQAAEVRVHINTIKPHGDAGLAAVPGRTRGDPKDYVTEDIVRLIIQERCAQTLFYDEHDKMQCFVAPVTKGDIAAWRGTHIE